MTASLGKILWKDCLSLKSPWYSAENQKIIKMPVDKIRVEGDERIRYEYATLNGRKYGAFH